MTVYIDYDFTDADNNLATFSCNRTDLFTDFNTDTGTGTWSTGSIGTYSVDFGVFDGQGSIDNYTMTITITDLPPTEFLPPTPVSLQNTSGNFWVNYSWQAGAGNVTDSYNVSIKGTWTNGTTLTYSNDAVSPHGTSTIIVYAYNTSADGTLSSGSLTDSVTIPNNPITITNTSDAIISEGQNIKIAKQTSTILDDLDVEPKGYLLATAHRQEDVDDPKRFLGVLHGLELVAEAFDIPVIYPIHTRSRKQLQEFGIQTNGRITFIDPVDFRDRFELFDFDLIKY